MMIETALKTTPYFQTTYPKQQQMRVINKAFQSLSFRGKRGYPSDILNKTKQTKPVQPSINKHKTYGAILRSRTESGKELYALVQGSYTGKWSFPKGHSNEGEEPLECTMREVGEETGIDELPTPIEYVQIGYGNYFVFNLDDQVPLIPRDTHEIMDTKWVTVEEMDRMPLNADVSQFKKNYQKAIVLSE
jgi:8-oxo-dGTP pyrophosphatase MutT (NUDIX family)